MIDDVVVTGRRARVDPLMVALCTLTIVTGLVDAVSYLALGHVFVANMTGNVVFLAFALAGAPGLSASSSLMAAGAFLIGALAGGRLANFLGRQRRQWLAVAFGLEFVLVVGATTLAAVTESPKAALICLLGCGMGVQNATVRKLAVPDMTTTVLTLTMTGLASDSRAAGGESPRWQRRTGTVALMFAGAIAGGFLVLHGSLVGALVAAAVLLIVTAAACLTVPVGRASGLGE